MTSSSSTPQRGSIAPLVWSFITLVGVIVAACFNLEAREVLISALMYLFGFVSTPFILESTVAIVGLSIVLAINHWRMQREEDEWVYLAQTEPDPSSGSETPPHRLDAVVLKERPEGGDALQTRLSVIEGYVELGLYQEARQSLESLQQDEAALPEVQALKARLEKTIPE